MNSHRLLVVDDDAPTRQLIRRVLAKQRYEVLEASNGQEAIHQVLAFRPDLVLMDVMMPVLDGFSACAQIRLEDGDESLPIIMLTGADDLDSIESAFNAGATDFITKPIHWTLLTERVRYALRTGQLNREVRRSRLREASVRRIAGLGYWEWQLDTNAFSWTDELGLITGLPQETVSTLPRLLERVHEEDRRRLLVALERARDMGLRLDHECRLRVDEREFVIRLVGERGTQSEELQQVYGAFQDVTETRRTQAMVDYLALHDELTGLGNRRLFMRQVAESLALRPRSSSSVLLVGVLDISRFARLNDTLGQSGADRLLAMISKRLTDPLNLHTGGLGRIGGDEFAFFFVADDDDEVPQRYHALFESLTAPFKCDGQDVFVSFSGGYSVFPRDGQDAETLLAKAQAAQRLARKQGRDYLAAETDEQTTRRRLLEIELERDLYAALANQEFFLLYQPQVAFAQRQVTGVEALIRWNHPRLGVLSPALFVGLLEETGLIHDVGTWVLREACRQAATWHRQGLDLRVGINLSPRQFLLDNLLEAIQEAVRDADVPSSLIELEITESLAMQDVTHTVHLLQRFRSAGFKIAVDDFGIGHSSLEYLLRFPIDVIKIDRAFVMEITSRVGDRAIVRAITVLAQALGLMVIAEGVETQRQSDFLEAIGVTEIQGYLIGKPMSASEIETMVHAHRQAARH
jgi:diguanylate cyclase (GGDEF)-like protein